MANDAGRSRRVSESKPSRRVGPVLVWAAAALAIVAAGAALRFHRLGQAELWGDEILYLRMCQPGLSVCQVFDEHLKSYSYIGHLPSAAFLSNVGMRLQGLRGKDDITPGNSRIPSAVVGVLTLLLLCLWIHRMTRNPTQALMALGVGAFSFVHIWYSREAYYYVGELGYAVAVLLCANELLIHRPSLARSSVWAMLFSLSSLGLAFSHPSGIALLAVLGFYALVKAVAADRANYRLYAIFLVAAVLTTMVLLVAGTGQQQAKASHVVRDAFWIEGYDLLEHMILGPGAWRAVLSALLLASGVWAVLRCATGPLKAFLLTIPALYLVLRIGGRNFGYHPRYFILLWPLLMWAMAAGAEDVVRRVSARWRPVALAAVLLLLAINVLPGLTLLYAIQGKGRQFGSLCAAMRERLAPGTLCVWDQGHANRFIPGFFDPGMPMVFGMLPDWRQEAYESGAVRTIFANLRENFPLVALLEYASCVSELPTSRGGGSGRTYRDELGEILPGQWDIHDPAYCRLEESRWIAGAPLRLAPGYRTWKEDFRTATARLYYTAPALIPDDIWPVFDPAAWQLAIMPNGTSLLLAGREAAVTLKGKTSLQAGQHRQVEAIVAALIPGTLRYAGAGLPAGEIRFGAPRETRRLLLACNWAQEMALRFSFVPAQATPSAGEALFGLLRMREVRPAPAGGTNGPAATGAPGGVP